MGVAVTVLCVDEKSNYRAIPGLDLWDKTRNAYLYSGNSPVIAHPPCQQWSRMKAFAKPDLEERDLAFFCLDVVKRNGGILEHPHGSSFFRYAGIRPTLCIDQHWFGFPARKRTWLYFVDVKPLPHPLSFDLVATKVELMHSGMRSRMPLTFCQWLVDCVKQTL